MTRDLRRRVDVFALRGRMLSAMQLTGKTIYKGSVTSRLSPLQSLRARVFFAFAPLEIQEFTYYPNDLRPKFYRSFRASFLANSVVCEGARKLDVHVES